MKYGIPYMGSKSAIVKEMLAVLPPAANFYDLFGGGMCVSHCALKLYPHKWGCVHYNEIQSDTVELIRDAIAGKYSYENFKPPFISREEFIETKDTSAYARLIWSFGNNQKGYLFGKDIEPRKRSLHNAVIFDQFDKLSTSLFGFNKWPSELRDIKARRLYIRAAVRRALGAAAPEQLQQLERLERLQQLERLERLEQLERLERLEQLTLSSHDYAAVEIKPNSVVYCDIPYKKTAGYLREFDHERFFKWASASEHPVFFSEFECADPTFAVVFEKQKHQRLAANAKDGKRRVFVERVYANRLAATLVKERALLAPQLSLESA